MTLNEQDAFNMAIDKLRVLFMAVKGAESIADQELAGSPRRQRS